MDKIVKNDTVRLLKALKEYDIIYCKHSHVKQVYSLIKAIASLQETMVAVDEVHAFRNSKSALATKFKMALSQCINFGLTATPLSKNLQDTYNIINLVSPWYLGSFVDFRDTYCLTREKIIGRMPGGKLRTALEIIGVRDEEKLKVKLEPLVIVGESFVDVKFHYLDYNSSPDEKKLYRKIAAGIGLNENLSNQDWLKSILETEELDPRPIKDVERHSSRFIYLQSAADGILTSSGTQDKTTSVKINILLETIKGIVESGNSTIVYFDFLAALESVKHAISQMNLRER